MAEFDAQEVAIHFAQLLPRVEAGEEIVIARGGTPIARLVPVGSRSRRAIGQDKGLFKVPEDFDAPLSQDELGYLVPPGTQRLRD